MLIEALIEIFVLNFLGIINLINPVFSGLDLPDDITTQVMSIFLGVAYFMPLIDLGLMLGISIAITNWHVVWRIIQRVWDALPFT